MKKYWRLVSAISAGLVMSVSAGDLYVWTNSPHPAPPYNAWTNAARDIQAAVSNAVDGDTVWVTNGVYRTGGWAAHGAMTSRVAVLYAVTVRSINGPSNTVIEGQGPIGDSAIRGVYLHSNATLIGFTVSNGHTRADGSWFYEQSGGGIACYNKSSVISNCMVRNNNAYDSGGGIADGTVYHCDVLGNSAGRQGGGVFLVRLQDGFVASNTSATWGGGSDSSLLLNSRIVGNSAVDGGGACNSTLSNCLVEANEATVGGGISTATAWWSTVRGNRARDGAGADQSTLFYCELLNNVAQEWGGGAYDCGGTWYGVLPRTLRMENCFVAGNQAEQGGGVYDCTLLNSTVVDNQALDGGGLYEGFITNSIVYYNHAFTDSSNYTAGLFGYSCTAPLPAGAGNIADEPGLVSLLNPHLLTNASCVDAGLSDAAAGVVDVDKESRIFGAAVDIGCDEILSSGLTGTLSVAIQAQAALASTAYPIQMTAVVSGKVTRLLWRWGDGQETSDALSSTHQYAATGTWWITLNAWNNDASASASTAVSVVNYQATFASPVGGNVYPYTSWGNAATTLQAAVDATPVGGQVWVGAGNYAQGGRSYKGMFNRLVVDKPIFLTATNQGVSQTIIRGAGPLGTGAVRCAYLTAGSRLEGFTLMGGATLSNSEYFATWNVCGGGGAISEDGVMSNCWIVGNSAARSGGGVIGGSIWNSYLAENMALKDGGGTQYSKLWYSLITSNFAQYGGGSMGGSAWYCSFLTNRCEWRGGGAQDISAQHCLFAANDARTGGGSADGEAAFCVYSNNTAEFGGGSAGGIVRDSWYIQNAAQNRGSMYNSGQGGACYGGSNINCVITRNSAGTYGGGCYGSSLYHCTVVDNVAGDGYGGGGVSGGLAYHSIIYYNHCTNAQYETTNAWGPDEMGYSCCGKDDPNDGDYQSNNIPDAPQFVNHSALNFRLISTSPCIDSGNPPEAEDFDLDGVARPLDGDANGTAIVDMGAYEYASPLADTDADHMSDSGEVLAGTNPRDDQSYLHLVSIGDAASLSTGMRVEWASVEGRRYNLALSTNLMTDSFGLIVLTNVVATPPLNTVTTLPGLGFSNAFYKIQLSE